jgi:aspartyl-tRNA(Asn)/glutamyl-tRNA(Gln) amidotransferase subunit C
VVNRVAISREQVKHVAHLARLGLSPTEAEMMSAQLSRILEHFANLNRLDTRAVPPTYHVQPLQTVVRPDQPHESLSRDLALANAPDSESNCFRVPKITEG